MGWSMDKELYDIAPSKTRGEHHISEPTSDVICVWNFCMYRPLYNEDQLAALANALSSFTNHVSVEGDIHQLLAIQNFQNSQQLRVTRFTLLTQNLTNPNREEPHSLRAWPTDGMKHMTLAPPPPKHQRSGSEESPLLHDTPADQPPPIVGKYITNNFGKRK